MSSRDYLILSLLFLTSLTTPARASSRGPLPQLTGGFSEQTCQMCHGSFPVNAGRTQGGVFYISGVPRQYQPGETYPIGVVLGQPGQSRWGFQLAVRSASSGGQGGLLVSLDALTQVTEEAGVQYVQHTREGSREGLGDGPVEYRFNWTAPDASAGAILFNAAGNASNGDSTPSGDYIFTASAFSETTGLVRELSSAGDEVRPRPSLRLNTTSRFMHLPAPVHLKRGDMETHIEHRFLQPIFDSSPGTAFGIDFGANINLGLTRALTDRISAGVNRTRFDQIIAFSGTYELRTDPNVWWHSSIHGGVEGKQNFTRHYSPFLQFTNAFDYKRIRMFLVPTVIFNSRRDEDLEFFSKGININKNHTFALGIATDLALHPRFSLTGEYVPRLAGFGGFENERSTLSWGVKLRTRGHVFTVLVTNGRNFTPAEYGVNAGTTDFALGFDLYRKTWR